MARQWSTERRRKNKAKIAAANNQVCTSAKEFKDALSIISNAAYEDLWDDVFSITAQFAYTAAQRTPHDTGRAKGGWQIGFEPTEYAPPETFTGTPQEVLAALESMIKRAAENDSRPPIIYVSNNVQYIMQLEAGHSRQAPNGMIAVTLAEMARGIEQAAREFNAQ